MIALVRHVQRAAKHTYQEWDTAELVLVGFLALLVSGLLLVVVNCVSGNEISRGAVYDYSYSYCAQTQTAYRQSSCVRYATATERRVDVTKQGYFWQYVTYEVVR